MRSGKERVRRYLVAVASRVPGLVWLKRRLFGRRIDPAAVSTSRPSDRPAPAIPSVQALANRYGPGGEQVGPDAFVLYRIIGNDLYPRHRKGQSRDNLRFILRHEPVLEGCEKVFVVNRIVDPEEEAAIIDLLEQAAMPYVRVPFDPAAYECLGWDIHGVPAQFAPHTARFDLMREDHKGRVIARLYRHKNNYVIHNNGARNLALKDGRGRAKWVLPWDGNCFVTEAAWDEIREGVLAQRELPFFIVPMARITNNDRLLEPGYRPTTEEEPQVIFRRDLDVAFDPAYFYGRRPKVELFWRMAVPGRWDDWPVEPWDLPCPDYAEQAGAHASVGWVARLFSGQAQYETARDEQAFKGRGSARIDGIAGMIDRLDEHILGPRLDRDRPVFLDARRAAVPEVLSAELRRQADAALSRGPFSVLDKSTLAPSGNPRDYWHPAPYYWPNPIPIPGLPYVRRDGQRVPGTRLYEPLSDRYDRTRLQRVFDDSFVLTLAAEQDGMNQAGEHAAALVRRWFIDPETAMTPHLRYAQVRRGRNRNQGSNFGIIEMKDLYYFLDAVRVLGARGYLSSHEVERFRGWLGDYLVWLRTSPQGCMERASRNNHGTYYDLQVASIAAYLGDYLLLRDTLRDSRFRIIEQFDADGRQPDEMRRTTTAHYCCFNLQGWIHLAQLAESVGEDLWGFEGPNGQSIGRGMEWLLPHMGEGWPYKQIDEFDSERFYPIYHAYRDRFGEPAGVAPGSVPDKPAIKPIFFPHDGIRPFWQLGNL